MKHSPNKYFEIYIIPETLLDIYADLIADISHEAIEFIESDSVFLPEIPPLTFYKNIFELKSTYMILRSDAEPKNLLFKLEEFASNTNTNFAYGYKICDNKDWIQIYKDSITPLETSRFIILPSWEESKSKKEKIIIDPALAFGSGHHATTNMCIEMLESMDLKGKTLLDVGAGSGILSIISAKLGAVINACDTDILAIEQCKKNAIINNVKFNEIWQGSINNCVKRNLTYNVIVANILAVVIKALHNDFKNVLESNGELIISGILEKYKDNVMEKFSDFEIEKIEQKDEWVAMKLRKSK